MQGHFSEKAFRKGGLGRVGKFGGCHAWMANLSLLDSVRVVFAGQFRYAYGRLLGPRNHVLVRESLSSGTRILQNILEFRHRKSLEVPILAASNASPFPLITFDEFTCSDRCFTWRLMPSFFGGIFGTCIRFVQVHTWTWRDKGAQRHVRAVFQRPNGVGGAVICLFPQGRSREILTGSWITCARMRKLIGPTAALSSSLPLRSSRVMPTCPFQC